MAAAKRNSGNGMIIALVIFIVLALAGIGTSIWLYQQKAILQRALKANQNRFKNEVASVFENEKWDMAKRVDSRFGFTYEKDSYRDVRSKLFDAAMLEDLRPVIGWDSPNSVKKALENSPVQQEQESQYKTIRGLLGFYEEEYQRLNKQVANRNSDLETTRTKLADKSEAMNQMQKRLMQEKTEAAQKYQEKIGEIREQYKGMQEEYKQAQNKVEKWQGKYDRAQESWTEKFGSLKNKARDWKKLYKEATAEEKAVKELQPAGSVLDVEPRYEFIVVEGGSKEGREEGQDIVLYTRSPDGVRTVKGRAVISNVYDTTSLATMVRQSAQVMKGDFFVPQASWQRHQEGKKVAEKSTEEVTETTIEVSRPEEPAKGAEEPDRSETPEEPKGEEPDGGTTQPQDEDGGDEDGEDEVDGGGGFEF